VALTFHGNGDPALAERLLALIEGHAARISVLAVGTWLVSHPEMATRILHGRQIDGLDWQDPPAATVVRAVLDGVRPGSIVSLHLGHQVTIAALPRILAGLSIKRLQPVTLTELLA
jgi:peptidoglycan/xylan/chitin deacetylase (PgdA/CDA1 family)